MGEVLIDIVVYISIGLAVSLLARQYGFNQILGYIVAGVFLGPNGFNVISLENWSNTAGEYGVAFLLFTLGLSVTWDKLWDLRFYVLIIGTLQISLSLFLFAGLMYWMGANIGLACLLGSLFAFSSTAVIGQIMSERNEFASDHGRITLSILLFQDFAVLFVLVLVNIHGAGNEFGGILPVLLKALSKAVLILLGCAVLWRFILRPLYRWVGATRSSDLLISMMLLIILLLALLTDIAGLSPELGAFLAGMLLSDTEYQAQVDIDIRPFKHLLLGLFFMTIGMRMNVDLLVGNLGMTLVMLCVLLLGKFILIFLILRLFGHAARNVAVRVACTLAGGSEFGILVLQRGKETFLFTHQLADVLSVVLILSLALTPLLSRLARMIGAYRQDDIEDELKLQGRVREHVVIAGAGAVGKTIIQALDQLQIPYIAIDNNLKRVQELREEREGVFYGDVRRVDVLEKANLHRAKVLVVCMDSFRNAERVMVLTAHNYPSVTTVVRVKQPAQAATVRQYGAIPIAPDAVVLGGDIVNHIMRAYSLSEERIDQVLQDIRGLYYVEK